MRSPGFAVARYVGRIRTILGAIRLTTKSLTHHILPKFLNEAISFLSLLCVADFV